VRFRRSNPCRWGPLLALALALLPFPAWAQIVNGSFESAPNHLTGWTLGPGARVEALQAGDFQPNSIPTPDGDWFALLSTGPGNVPTAPGGDFDANGRNDFDATTLTTSFTTTTANETLSFNWSFLTDEIGPGGQGQANFDDLFDITIDGTSIVRGSVNKPGGISPYQDTAPYDGLRYIVQSAGLTDNSDFGSQGGGRTPFATVCLKIAAAGTYTLEFLVADQGDSVFDSGLLIDNVALNGSCNPMTQVTVSQGDSLEANGGGLVFTQVTNERAELDANGLTLAFRSNGDFNGDNPNLEEQLWYARWNATSWDATRITAFVGADSGNPTISANGQWIAFASSGDSLGSNADGNRELFLYDRIADSLTQLTSTTACNNRTPTVNDDGSRIAFVSDCDLGLGSVADDEIVLWDGTFRGVDTSGCVNRSPRISRNAAGRYITFVTSCSGGYGAVTNPDANQEIVQWDSTTDLYLAITDTTGSRTSDVPGSSADGRFVSFVSNADLEAGENPIGAWVVFRYDTLSDTYLQMTDAAPLLAYTFAAIDDSGSLLTTEEIDLTSGAISVYFVNAAQPRMLALIAAGTPTVVNSLPTVSTQSNRPIVSFVSNGDFSSNNADANVEIWSSGAAFVPPVTASLCNSPNAAIPDSSPAGTADTITVPAGATLVDLDIFIDIQHSFVGDLRVDLVHLDTGTSRRLVDRPGRPPGAGCSGDDVLATLDDEAGAFFENECVRPGPVAIAGSLRPRRSLSRFDGESLAGDWRLTVSDRRNNNTGIFVQWCLIPTTQ